jgi:hypothetical protein
VTRPQWLWENGSGRVWLTTALGTRAVRFHERRGWIANGRGKHGDVRHEHVKAGSAMDGRAESDPDARHMMPGTP